MIILILIDAIAMDKIIKLKKAFSGGLHIEEFKEQTENEPIQEIPLPKKVFLPLIQHLGGPSKPLVQVGDTVKTGQQIAQGEGFISAHNASSITGKVTAIEERYHPLGFKDTTIVIERSGEEEWETLTINKHPKYMSRQEVLQWIEKAGIVGLGGASFPTHIKLNPPPNKHIDTLVVNAAECEPFLNVDNRLLLEKTDEFINALRLVYRILDVERCFIGIEDNKPEAISALKKAIKSIPNFYLAIIPTCYPQGGEKQLIYSVLQREVPSGKLPLDIGVIVINVHTIFSLYEALFNKKPLIEKVITVAGDGVEKPGNYLVRLGTTFGDILEHCGGYVEDRCKIIMGGPMMGFSQFTEEVPVIKGTSGILVFTEKYARLREVEPCIQCGRCVTSCPMKLTPVLLGRYIENEHFDRVKELHLRDCMECGCCNYICPANRPLVQLFKYGKIKLNQLQ